MTISLLLASTLGILGVAAEYQPQVDEIIHEVSWDSLASIIEDLSGEVPVTIEGEKDSIPCRHSYTAGHLRAALWLKEQFEVRGFTAEVVSFEGDDPGPPYHEYRPLPIGVDDPSMIPQLSEPITMYNVVATLPGKDAEQVLLTAHFDATSEGNKAYSYTPGADDNASGVAGVLEAARLMSAHEWQHTLRFVLFGGEEQGLLGSEAYVEDAVENGDSMIAVFNMDMISYDGDGYPEVDVHCNPFDQASQEMGQTVAELMDVYELDLVPDQHIADATDRSDHYWFWLYGIPAVLLIEDFDDFTPFYHHITDRILTLDTSFMVASTRTALAWAATTAALYEPVACSERPPSSTPTRIKLSSSLARGNVWMDISSPQPVTPSIYDASGRVAKTLPSVPASSEVQRINIDLSDLAGGVYWVRVSGAGGTLSERLVLVR